MGKKRKKSKGRKKRRRQSQADAPAPSSAKEEPSDASGEDGEAAADEAKGVEDGEPAAEDTEGAEDPEAAEGPAEQTGGGESLDDARLVEVVDLDEDLDDPEVRAELVAAAAELTERAEEDEDAGQAGDEAEADTEVASGDVRDDEVPVIGPDALLALSEFRDEGVATIPEELVLELGEAASAEERDRLLAAALAHAEMQDAIYRVPLESATARRWKGLIAAALFVLALFLVGLPPGFLVPEAPPPLTTEERLLGIRTALLLQAEQVEAFRVREDRLPTSLAEVETALPGIRFVRSSNRLYQLVAYTPEGDAVVYDSASPHPAFSDVSASWVAPEGES